VRSGGQTSADTPNTGDGVRRQMRATFSDENANRNNTHNDARSEHPQCAIANLTDMATPATGVRMSRKIKVQRNFCI
jgi:hypothetical protein